MDRWIGVIAGKSGDTITDELHRRNFKVALVVGKDNEAGIDIADKVFICDLRKHTLIKNFFSEMNIKNILFATGHRLAIDLAKNLQIDGFNISLDLNKVKLCKNKYLFKEKIKLAGFNTPKFILIAKNEINNTLLNKIKKEIGFPCVLKSIEDICEPEKIFDLDELLRRLDFFLGKEEFVFVEEFIDGADCTVPVFYNGQQIIDINIIDWSKGLEDHLRGFEDSYSKKFTLLEKNTIFEVTKKLIKKFELNGLIRVDIIVNKKNKIYILEVNTIIVSGNTGSSYNIKFLQAGINRASYIVDYALEKFYKIQFQRLEKYLVIVKNIQFNELVNYKNIILEKCLFQNNYQYMWESVLKSNTDYICIKLNEFSNAEYTMLQNIAKDLNKKIILED